MEKITSVTASEMKEIDRLMIEELKVELLQMMENAGRNLAEFARNWFLNFDANNKRVTIIVGTGGNGGGGMVCARFLHNWGANVWVITSKDHKEYKGVPKKQLDILINMGIAVKKLENLQDIQNPQDIIIDALIGYGLKDEPKNNVKLLIKWMNHQKCNKISLDIPSGLDATTGHSYQNVVKADATLTLGLPKTGLMQKRSNKYVGVLFVSDIGIPVHLYGKLGLKTDFFPIFNKKSIIKIADL
jgi:NAD(P)H-hydrate epimerase